MTADGHRTDDLSIGVFCSAAEGIPKRFIDLAERVGRGIAALGWTLVSGGEGVSMMGALARGARDCGGHTVGVIARQLMDRVDQECGELVVTESISARKKVMLARAHALLVLPGGLGTCEELFAAWMERTLDPRARPVVVLEADGHFVDLLRWIDGASCRGFINAHARRALIVATDVEEALVACRRSALDRVEQWPLALSVASNTRNGTRLAPIGPVAAEPGAGSPPPSDTTGTTDLLRRLDAAGPDNGRRVVASFLAEQVRRVLGLDPQEHIEPRLPLSELGLDSLTALEMRTRLNKAVGHEVPVTILFDYPTLELLTSYVVDEVIHVPVCSNLGLTDGDRA